METGISMAAFAKEAEVYWSSTIGEGGKASCDIQLPSSDPIICTNGSWRYDTDAGVGRPHNPNHFFQELGKNNIYSLQSHTISPYLEEENMKLNIVQRKVGQTNC